VEGRDGGGSQGGGMTKSAEGPSNGAARRSGGLLVPVAVRWPDGTAQIFLANVAR